MNKKTVVFDFDGVIHSYTSGWIGDTAIPDPPFPGIREAIVDIRKKYRVVVVSTRCASEEGKAAIKEWLAKYDIVVDDITKEKPPAVVYIDDRAICFDGHADLLAARIEAFQPFYSAKHAGFLTFEDAQKWYDAYHRVKHELERERMYHRETEKLADKYFAECKHLQRMLEAAIAGQETLQKEISKWVKECEELQERLIEYEGMDFGQDMGMQAPAQPGGTPQMPGAENLAGFGKEPANVEKARKRSQGASQPGGGKQ